MRWKLSHTGVSGAIIFFIIFQVAKEWFQNRVFSRPFNTPQFWVAHLQFSGRDNACKWCSDLLFNFVADEASSDGANKETKVSSKIVQPPNTVTYTVSGEWYYTESQTWPFFCAASAAACREREYDYYIDRSERLCSLRAEREVR